MSAKPTAKELHERCQKLGITAKIAGKPLNKLIEEAHASDDPIGFLELFAPGPIGDIAKAKEIVRANVGDAHALDGASAWHCAKAAATVVEPPAGETPLPQTAAKVSPKPTAGVLEAAVDIPYLAADDDVNAIQQLHLDVQLRDQKTARAFKRFYLSLLEQDARLSNGRHVESFPQAVAWLFEQFAAAMDREPGTFSISACQRTAKFLENWAKEKAMPEDSPLREIIDSLRDPLLTPA